MVKRAFRRKQACFQNGASCKHGRTKATTFTLAAAKMNLWTHSRGPALSMQYPNVPKLIVELW